MKRYKTPAGNEYSEEELRSKYGEQFDSLVADGTLELVGEAIDTEKKTLSLLLQMGKRQLRYLLQKRKHLLGLRMV